MKMAGAVSAGLEEKAPRGNSTPLCGELAPLQWQGSGQQKVRFWPQEGSPVAQEQLKTSEVGLVLFPHSSSAAPSCTLTSLTRGLPAVPQSWLYPGLFLDSSAPKNRGQSGQSSGNNQRGSRNSQRSWHTLPCSLQIWASMSLGTASSFLTR